MNVDWRKTRKKKQNVKLLLKELKSYVDLEHYYSAYYVCSKLIDELKK